MENNVFVTIISGVSVFVLSQLFIEFALKPIQKYNSLRAKVSYCLTYYGNTFTNPIDNTKIAENKYTWWEEASTELRKMASELQAFADERPLFFIFTPKKKSLFKSAQCLRKLSNSMYSSKENSICHIETALKNVKCIKDNLKLGDE